jgi:uncharacterized protein YegP (UPF0339 family)
MRTRLLTQEVVVVVSRIAKVATIVSEYEVAFAIESARDIQVDDIATIHHTVDVRDPDTHRSLGTVRRPLVKFRIFEVQPRFALGRTYEFAPSQDPNLRTPFSDIASKVARERRRFRVTGDESKADWTTIYVKPGDLAEIEPSTKSRATISSPPEDVDLPGDRARSSIRVRCPLGDYEGIVSQYDSRHPPVCPNHPNTPLVVATVASRFVLKKTLKGKYYFSLISSRGQVIAVSETYESKGSAMNAIESIRQGASEADYDDATEQG